MKTIKEIAMISLSLVFFFSCTTSSYIKDETKEYRLESFSVYDGSENLIQTVSIEYNEMYKPTEIITMGEDGNKLNQKLMTYNNFEKLLFLKSFSTETNYILSDYIYDSENFLTKVQIVNEKEELLGTSSYINDERGNPIEWHSESRGNSEETHFLLEYNDANHLIKSSELNKEGNIIYYSISEYDERGNEILYAIYSPEGVIDQQLVSSYKEDQLLRTEIIDEKGEILFHTEYELNEMDKPIKILSYNQYDDLTARIEITYDDKGNELIRKSFDFNGNIIDKIEKRYDEAGNNITLTIYDSNNEVITTTRNIYDKQPLHMGEEEFNNLVFKL